MSCAVILTALPVEYLAVRAHLQALQEEVHAQWKIYERGTFSANGQEWEVGIVEIGAGNVGAALETERAIAHFKPDLILFVGVAGGIKDVAIGDVVASTKIYGYESGKADERFKPRPEIGLSAYNLVERARAEANKGDWLERLAVVPEMKPRVFVGPIASGERVIGSKESEIFKFIRASYNDAVAVDMEGFGFLQAAFAYPNIQAIVIRGISDLIKDKNLKDPKNGTEDQRQREASHNASAFAFEVLAKLEINVKDSSKSRAETTTSNMNPQQKQRLERRKETLQTEWNIRNEKLEQLRQAYAIESGIAIKFQLEKQIQDEEKLIGKLEDELTDIEQSLHVSVDHTSQERSLQLNSHFSDFNERILENYTQQISSLTTITFDVTRIDAVGQQESLIQKTNYSFIEQLSDDITLEMILVPSGEFLMGGPNYEVKKLQDEIPQHSVNVHSFFMSRYPVTQSQWEMVSYLPKLERNLENTPSFFKGVNHPVDSVSWYDALEFCARLSVKTGRPYRLPSEAEWEYACRAGTASPFHFGEAIISRLANYNCNIRYSYETQGIFRQKTTSVDTFRIFNSFGLCDMHGNVWEWCADPWHRNYENAPSTHIIWTENADPDYRVMRGGSWNSLPEFCRSSYRMKGKLEKRGDGIGFRVVLSML